MTRKLRNLLFVIFLCVTGASAGKNTITIGTFNIQHFGKHTSRQRIKNLAEICRGIDLLAIEEVYEKGNAVRSLAQAMGKEYSWAVSQVTTHERFGLIWRAPVEALQPAKFAPGLDLGRDPYWGRFRAGTFDFEVLVVHLFWDGSKKTYPHTRGAELKLLDDWLTHRKSTELDLIILGDFNEPNRYHGYIRAPQYSFHSMFYRFLARHNLRSLTLEKGIPTSIANQNIYDHILINTDRYLCSEFAGMDQVRVIKWDRKYDKNGNRSLDRKEFETARRAVSDHRLVTARFRTDMGDDD